MLMDKNTLLDNVQILNDTIGEQLQPERKQYTKRKQNKSVETKLEKKIVVVTVLTHSLP